MADHIWTVLCFKALAEAETKVISLIEVVEKIMLNGEEDPGELVEQAKSKGGKGLRFDVRLQLVTWWIRSNPDSPETVPLRVGFINPEGERIYEQAFEVDLQEDAASRRTIINYKHLWMTGFGRYWFVVEQQKKGRGKAPGWVVATRVPLEIEPARVDS